MGTLGKWFIISCSVLMVGLMAAGAGIVAHGLPASEWPSVLGLTTFTGILVLAGTVNLVEMEP